MLNINQDEWIRYRHVWVRKTIIVDLEQETGGKIILDGTPENNQILLTLDEVCRQVWASEQHGKFKHPPNRSYVTNMVTGINERFTWRPIPIEMGPGQIIHAVGPKKMWFRSKALF